MNKVTGNALSRLLTLMAALVLTACATRQEAPSPPVALADAFTRTGVQPAMTDTWWQSFDNEPLNRLVAQAMADNPGLKASYQRLRQARAVADRQGSALFPSLEASAGAEQQESDTLDARTFSAGISARYEIDIWGRIRSLSEAEALRASATMEDYQAAAVSLSGEIATAWFQLLEQRAQSVLAESQLKTNQKVLAVIESRFASGQSGSADVLRQRQLTSTSRARQDDIAGEIRVLEHQLAVLLGQPPGGNSLPQDETLPMLPPLPETGIPAELVQRRPDLRQAWWLLRAADKDLAAAISNRFPRVSLEASVSARANDASDLFNDWLTTLAANLLVPLVDGGDRRAEVRRSRAVLEERLQQYGQAVLVAVQEVEDALAREQQQSRRLASQEEQIRLADTTYRQLRNQYLNGAARYIDVLTALQDKQELQRAKLTTRQQLLTTRVALYRALAGGIAPEDANNTQTDRSEPAGMEKSES
ncbi:MAG: efflux transporter outer membrane subunit [Oleiphilaceae bacterium]|nr:efflux transporter outer membrane subunit [Oleiphilaceae bacterium]